MQTVRPILWVTLILAACEPSSKKKDGEESLKLAVPAVPEVKKAITQLSQEDLSPGKGKRQVSWDDEVKVKLQVSMIAGDESIPVQLDQDTWEFKVGKGQMIFGLEKGVVGMKVEGKRRLKVPYHLAYGHRGLPGKVHPYAPLLLEVELVSIR